MGIAELPDVLSVVLRRHRLTVDEYYRMSELGVLPREARTELIEGEIIDMNSIGTRHASMVMRLNRLLQAAVGDSALVNVQNPVRLSNFDEPEPDLALLRPRSDFYAEAHPTAADVLLIIEVADSSLEYDRRIKAPLYARHGVVEFWLVDLEHREVRFFRQPLGEAYTDITASESPGRVPLLALPQVSIDLSGLFG